jgi:hypothetical protein
VECGKIRPVRIIIGVLFACHGAQKLFGVLGEVVAEHLGPP